MERKLFEELTKSVKQAGAIARGERKPARKHAYSATRLQAIREKAELSQAQFARLLNVSVRTLQNWEQDRREPTGPAKALLRIVEQEPELALRALGQSDSPARVVRYATRSSVRVGALKGQIPAEVMDTVEKPLSKREVKRLFGGAIEP